MPICTAQRKFVYSLGSEPHQLCFDYRGNRQWIVAGDRVAWRFDLRHRRGDQLSDDGSKSSVFHFVQSECRHSTRHMFVSTQQCASPGGGRRSQHCQHKHDDCKFVDLISIREFRDQWVCAKPTFTVRDQYQSSKSTVFLRNTIVPAKSEFCAIFNGTRNAWVVPDAI